MRKIVDPSFLRHPDLEKYFREDLGNQVVFSDYACMESYKGDSLKNLQQSLKTVAAWPDRVIVLKGTRDIIRIQTNPRHVIDDFIDTEQTSEFRQFFGQLNEVAQGNVVLAQRMRTLTEIAHKHFERMRADAAGVAEAIGRSPTHFVRAS